MRSMPYIIIGRLALTTLLFVSLIPAPDHAEDRNPGLKLPTIVAGAAAAADWASTYHALKNYQVREMNPLLRPWEDRPGKLVTAGAIMDGVAFTTWNLTMGRRHPKIAAAGMWA